MARNFCPVCNDFWLLMLLTVERYTFVSLLDQRWLLPVLLSLIAVMFCRRITEYPDSHSGLWQWQWRGDRNRRLRFTVDFDCDLLHDSTGRFCFVGCRLAAWLFPPKKYGSVYSDTTLIKNSRPCSAKNTRRRRHCYITSKCINAWLMGLWLPCYLIVFTCSKVPWAMAGWRRKMCCGAGDVIYCTFRWRSLLSNGSQTGRSW
jgi:hypothetical protein